MSSAQWVVFGGLVLLPLRLQTQMGYTAIWAGYAVAPIGVGAVIAGPIAGRLSTRVDPRVLVTIGVLFIMASFFLRSHFTTDADFVTIALPQILQGSRAADSDGSRTDHYRALNSCCACTVLARHDSGQHDRRAGAD